MKSRKNGKIFQKLKISLSKQTNLIIKHGFSSAVRRAGPNSDSAGPNMDSARPFAKLDLKQIPPTVRQAGPDQFGERMSWINRNPSSPRPRNSSPEIAANSFLFRFDQRHRWNFTI
ncbi:hypothetical protein F2Q69_00034902 [Brassica cretica]|uniref:Uncharacterized protein n=1 Tax=Brassica cretica TaxID=69181 RepID=A0A8S9SS11_BRACR|nr:hypothetical protein F2Q69_00034902 [Brassica cretica]